MIDLYIYIILKFMYAPSDYVEVEIRQEKSKCKIKRNWKYNENYINSSAYK